MFVTQVKSLCLVWEDPQGKTTAGNITTPLLALLQILVAYGGISLVCFTSISALGFCWSYKNINYVTCRIWREKLSLEIWVRYEYFFLCPRTICNMFYTNSHTYSLRQRDFHLPRFNTVTYGKHSIRYLGPRLWSKLTNKERSAINLKQFKTHVRRLDLGNILDVIIVTITITHYYYSLLITHYSLLITHYSLLITHYSLLITHYSLLITHYSLLLLLSVVKPKPNQLLTN